MQGPPHSRAGNILRAWLTRRRQPRALLSGGFFVHSSSLVARTFMDGLAWLAAGGNDSNPPPFARCRVFYYYTFADREQQQKGRM